MAHYKAFRIYSEDTDCLCDQNGVFAIVNDGSQVGALKRNSDTEYEFSNSIAQAYSGEKKTIASFSDGLESFEWGGIVFTHSSRNFYQVNPSPASL